MKEIVAAKIGSLITNDPRTIGSAIERNATMEFLDRQRMQFMAAMDLGTKWGKLANSKILFCIDDDGKPQPPNV